MVIDADDTNANTYGGQQLTLFNAYYNEYCYMPLMLFDGLTGKLMLPLPPDTAPAKRQEGEVAVEIPYYKSHDPRVYNHITETGKRAIVELLKDDFDLDVWEYLHDFGKIGRQQKDLIYLLEEQRGIRPRHQPISHHLRSHLLRPKSPRQSNSIKSRSTRAAIY